MSIVKEEHKATLRKWREELQAKRGNRASLRRSTTVNDVCLSEGFRSLPTLCGKLKHKSGVLPHWRWSPQLAPM